MKKTSPKSRFILTAAVIILAVSIGCAQTLAAPDQTDNIINNSQTARWKLRQAGILAINDFQTSDANPLRHANTAKAQLQEVMDRIQTLKSPKPKPHTAADIQPVQPAQPTEAMQQPEPAMSKPDKRQTAKTPPLITLSMHSTP